MMIDICSFTLSIRDEADEALRAARLLPILPFHYVKLITPFPTFIRHAAPHLGRLAPFSLHIIIIIDTAWRDTSMMMMPRAPIS